jgi:hypothetical protein
MRHKADKTREQRHANDITFRIHMGFKRRYFAGISGSFGNGVSVYIPAKERKDK